MPSSGNTIVVAPSPKKKHHLTRTTIIIIIIVVVLLLIIIGVVIYFVLKAISKAKTASSGNNRSAGTTGDLNDPCNSDGTCLTLFICDTGSICKSKTNGPCATTADCNVSTGSKYSCTNNQCLLLTGQTCTSNMQCTSGTCTQATGVCS